MTTASRLDATANERRRMLDMGRRFTMKLGAAYAGATLVVLAAAPTYGWWLPPVLILDVAKTLLVSVAMRRSARPERWLLAGFTLSLTFLAGAVWFTGGVGSPFMPWMAVFAALLPALLSGWVLAAGLTALAGCVVIAAYGQALVDGPPAEVGLGALAVMITTVVTSGLEMMRSDTTHRSELLIDPLTRLPNRRAFELRLTELEESPLLDERVVSIIVADIDHFKRVNDEYGHDRGDEVLVGVANELRGSLRASDVPYRVGGEEFVFILSHTRARDAAVLAEMLRGRFEIDGSPQLGVTLSFGVATSRPGEPLERVYRAADQALLQAKRNGRNRVWVSG